jgi:simple sugar transport system permease protein
VVFVLWFVLFKTKLGLRARAVGEHPLAADTVGINVGRTRFWWVTLGGLLAGLGGATLTIGNAGAFGREMSGGLGFIALAVVILGRWHPIYAASAALLFGFSIILRIWANQVSPGIPTSFITMVPFAISSRIRLSDRIIQTCFCWPFERKRNSPFSRGYATVLSTRY